MKKLLNSILCIILISASHLAASANSKADKEIKNLYKHLPSSLKKTNKIEWLSQQFLEKPYVLGPLGEGENGLYDQSPLYRTDAFDCTTYIETVIALSNASNLNEFKYHINNIRYFGKKPNYLQRNHFMSLDWLINNSIKGYIVDITDKIKNSNNQSIHKITTTTIDKSAWLKHKTIKDIKIENSSQKQKTLNKLHSRADKIKPQTSTIKYLPLTELFNKSKQSNNHLFRQIPHASIINIVRPNWQLKNKIGTNLHISHLGFAIRKNNKLYFREASSIKKKVIDIPLDSYLRNYLSSPTIKGINVVEIQ